MNLSDIKKRRVVPFVVYCIFILSIIVLADMGRLPLYMLYRIPHYDWIAHFFLYGLFYLILNNFINEKKISIVGKNFSLSYLIILLIIIGEEISQLFFPTRTFSLADLLMGFLGISIADWLKIKWRAFK